MNLQIARYWSHREKYVLSDVSLEVVREVTHEQLNMLRTIVLLYIYELVMYYIYIYTNFFLLLVKDHVSFMLC